jgi:hypothetical protein
MLLSIHVINNTQQRLEKILTNLPLDDLETQDEKLASMVDHQHDLLAQLTLAAERGDKQSVENLSQQLRQHNQQLTEFGRQVASTSEDPVLRKRAQDCCDDLDSLVADVISKANVIVLNPNDALARARLEDAASRTHQQTNSLFV